MTADLELTVERVLDAPVAAVWRAWEDHLSEWWCPRPWTTEVRALELQAGGRIDLVMRGPRGEEHPVSGLVLDAVPERRVAFTNALDAGLRPRSPDPVPIVAVFDMTPKGGRTDYRAVARHWTMEALDAHVAMGFREGWAAVADQLEEVARRIAG